MRRYSLHGMRNTKLYNTWRAMKERCNNKKYQGYYAYGGKGIKLYDQWYNFIPFKDWALKNGYEEGLSIDRIDSTKDYCPDNCRFISMDENLRSIRFSNKTSKYIGVSFIKDKNTYSGGIHFKNNKFIKKFYLEENAARFHDSILKYYCPESSAYNFDNTIPMSFQEARNFYEKLDKPYKFLKTKQLNDIQVRIIKRLLSMNVSVKDISYILNIKRSNINDIKYESKFSSIDINEPYDYSFIDDYVNRDN